MRYHLTLTGIARIKKKRKEQVLVRSPRNGNTVLCWRGCETVQPLRTTVTWDLGHRVCSVGRRGAVFEPQTLPVGAV